MLPEICKYPLLIIQDDLASGRTATPLWSFLPPARGDKLLIHAAYNFSALKHTGSRNFSEICDKSPTISEKPYSGHSSRNSNALWRQRAIRTSVLYDEAKTGRSDGPTFPVIDMSPHSRVGVSIRVHACIDAHRATPSKC